MKKINIAVILSGGGGERSQLEYPKQFFKVAGKTVIEHTLNQFEQNDKIEQIIIVMNPNYIKEIEDIVIKNCFKKITKILSGGNTRYQSSLIAINSIDSPPNSVNIIFHDAVRPLIDQNIINHVIEALDMYEAVDVAIPTPDTIVRVEDGIITEIPEREKLFRGQTPQGFHLETIKKAYDIALKDPLFKTTDDCGVVKKYLPEVKIGLVQGSVYNMKITYPVDTYIIEKYFQLKSEIIKPEDDYRFLNGKTIVVFGGSSGIGKEICNIGMRYNANFYSFSRSQNNCDITNREKVKEALNYVIKETGKIDAVINCVGILYKIPLNNMKMEDIYQIVNTNLLGTIIVAKESFEYLKSTKGHLICFTSSSYTRGRPYYSIYSSTKSGIVNFCQAISLEWEPYGIKVNCINPERTKTPLRIKNFGNEDENKLLQPEYVAKITLLVLNKTFTGQVIDIKKK
jgi:2-C-methyl-D-erythritol 4-phosphate cytidylyltransferase